MESSADFPAMLTASPLLNHIEAQAVFHDRMALILRGAVRAAD